MLRLLGAVLVLALVVLVLIFRIPAPPSRE
jgi:hypothetical protein